MPANTQFSIAVHLMAGLGHGSAAEATSARLASSVNTSPSFVRRIIAKLSKAGLVTTTFGKAGTCRLAWDPDEISLLDIYQAVDPPKSFAIHDYPEQKQCPVSCNIRSSMTRVLDRTQRSFEKSLADITLADLIGDLEGT
ncbi:MAG: Rrf2 family transcriptional regulator [Pyrinomonadaceae bacterium]